MSPLLRLESCALEKHVGGLTPEHRNALLSGNKVVTDVAKVTPTPHVGVGAPGLRRGLPSLH